LPARDSIKPSIGARTTDFIDFKPVAHILPSSPVQPARQQSLGLDSDDEVLDDAESVDLRAPELIAHEERMKEYESSSPPPATEPVMPELEEPEIPEPETETESIEQLDQPENIIEDIDDASIEAQSPEESATQITLLETIKEAPDDIIDDADNASIEGQAPAESVSQTTSEETIKGVPLPASRPSQVRPPTTRRLAAPKTFGRPVRPTNIAKPQPVPIKIKPLTQPKPIEMCFPFLSTFSSCLLIFGSFFLLLVAFELF